MFLVFLVFQISGACDLTGIWDDSAAVDHNSIVADGNTFYTFNPTQHWSPAEGVVDGQNITWRSHTATLDEACTSITWDNGHVWFKADVELCDLTGQWRVASNGAFVQLDTTGHLVSAAAKDLEWSNANGTLYFSEIDLLGSMGVVEPDCSTIGWLDGGTWTRYACDITGRWRDNSENGITVVSSGDTFHAYSEDLAWGTQDGTVYGTLVEFGPVSGEVDLECSTITFDDGTEWEFVGEGVCAIDGAWDTALERVDLMVEDHDVSMMTTADGLIVGTYYGAVVKLNGLVGTVSANCAAIGWSDGAYWHKACDFTGLWLDGDGGITSVVSNEGDVHFYNPTQPWSPSSGDSFGISVTWPDFVPGTATTDCDSIEWADGSVWTKTDDEICSIDGLWYSGTHGVIDMTNVAHQINAVGVEAQMWSPATGTFYLQTVELLGMTGVVENDCNRIGWEDGSEWMRECDLTGLWTDSATDEHNSIVSKGHVFHAFNPSMHWSPSYGVAYGTGLTWRTHTGTVNYECDEITWDNLHVWTLTDVEMCDLSGTWTSSVDGSVWTIQSNFHEVTATGVDGDFSGSLFNSTVHIVDLSLVGVAETNCDRIGWYGGFEWVKEGAEPTSSTSSTTSETSAFETTTATTTAASSTSTTSTSTTTATTTSTTSAEVVEVSVMNAGYSADAKPPNSAVVWFVLVVGLLMSCSACACMAKIAMGPKQSGYNVS